MIDPQRLIQADNEFERNLIRSAREDRPSHRALDRMLLGLGVELSQVPSALASAGASAAAGGKIGGLVLAKWVLGGVALGLVTITGAEVVGRAPQTPDRHVSEAPKRRIERSPSLAASLRQDPSPMPEVAASTAQATTSPSLSDARLRSIVTPAREVAEGSVPGPAAALSSNPSTALSPTARYAALPAQAAPVATTALAEEMRLLDAVRRSLASGDSRSALSILAGYERAFPQGALRPEASVLKVRALLAAGDRQGAEALGQRVIERAPRSEHADAVRAALGANP
ncbi:MAG TPA: hypothetical protein VHM25_01285 [Polyangiaceae bacterium]|nr:hypothetical protein [Polyangiaceae bacterium]